MNAIKYKTKIDWWIALLLAIAGLVMPAVFAIGIFVGWFAESEANEIKIIAFTAGFMFAIIAFVSAMSFIAAQYTLDREGINVRNTFFHKKRLAYSDIISFEKSVNMINRPKTWAAPFSVVGVRIDYRTESGETWLFIAPRKRERFMCDLQKRIDENSR